MDDKVGDGMVCKDDILASLASSKVERECLVLPLFPDRNVLSPTIRKDLSLDKLQMVGKDRKDVLHSDKSHSMAMVAFFPWGELAAHSIHFVVGTFFFLGRAFRCDPDEQF